MSLETTEERQVRQQHDAELHKREEHLKKRREADRRRREAEKRHARLDRQKAYRQNQKAFETEDQRAARLAQLRQQRLSLETEEQRSPRLAQMCQHQQQRYRLLHCTIATLYLCICLLCNNPTMRRLAPTMFHISLVVSIYQY